VTHLRIKNWGDLQHYSERRPPWIKLYRRLLEDNRFLELDEFAQWQLVRIWLLASRSETTVTDLDGREVPVVVNSEPALRRAIGTLKKLPLKQFIRDGWLVPVCVPGASASASAGDSETLALSIEDRDLEKERKPKGLFVASSAADLIDHSLREVS